VINDVSKLSRCWDAKACTEVMNSCVNCILVKGSVDEIDI
jgi:hypothetical protein